VCAAVSVVVLFWVLWVHFSAFGFSVILDKWEIIPVAGFSSKFAQLCNTLHHAEIFQSFLKPYDINIQHSRDVILSAGTVWLTVVGSMK
jgi:hypothetical protein